MAGNIKELRCAIYTRKSTEHGLEQEFNSLDAQRDACESYIKSQASQGWKVRPERYDDPAYSGGTLDRPALKKLLKDIKEGKVDVVVVYKIDRLTRSLADFAKLVLAVAARIRDLCEADTGRRGPVCITEPRHRACSARALPSLGWEGFKPA